MGKRKRSGSFSRTDDGASKKSDEWDECGDEVELETPSSAAKCLINATRCSARVQEKQEKLRRESSPSKQLPVVEVNFSTATPTTATTIPVGVVSKGTIKSTSPNNEEVSSNLDPVNNTSSVPVGFEEKRKKRNWEVWSMEDKQLFFEALNEYGKDFDAIQNYIATKMKPRNKAIICGQYGAKNKEQVRHFYYRTWNKISPHLRFPSGMKKASQELYGLINYGEIRKKLRILNSKSAAKLGELVEKGITSVKFKGKTCRIKTPVCRALKKLNGLEEVEHTRVPNRVCFELTPKDGKTWRSIQRLSQNPRIKLQVSLQRTFASVISYLENKWKTQDDRLKEQFTSVFGRPRSLRVFPVEKAELSIPLYKVAENTNSATICLSSYTKKVLTKEKLEEAECLNRKLKHKRKPTSSIPLQSTNPDVLANGSGKVELECLGADVETSDCESQLNHSHKELDERSNEMAWLRFQKKWLDDDEYHDGLGCGSGLEDNRIGDVPVGSPKTPRTDNDDVDTENEDMAPKLCACGSSKVGEPENFVSHVWDEERMRIGWNSDEAGVMTVGEVYLMLGQANKICFKYSWEQSGKDVEVGRHHNILSRLIDTVRFLKKKKTAKSKLSQNSIVKGNMTSGECYKCNPRPQEGSGSPIPSSTNPVCVTSINGTSVPQVSSVPITVHASADSAASQSFVPVTAMTIISDATTIPQIQCPSHEIHSKTASGESNPTILRSLPPIASSSSDKLVKILPKENPTSQILVSNREVKLIDLTDGNANSIDANDQDKMTFHQPPIRVIDPSLIKEPEFPPPKPFLDLPKGNRRLGRRPSYKRVVVPRVLPLLPKPPTIVSVLPASHNFVVSSGSIVSVSNASLVSEPPVTTISLSSGNSIQNIYSSSSVVSCTDMSKFGSASQVDEKPNIDFDDPLKLRKIAEVKRGMPVDMDNLSLSSFMEISLPESTKMVASELNEDLIGDLENSNSNLNISLTSELEGVKTAIRDNSSLQTPKKISQQDDEEHPLSNLEIPWNMDSGDVSLGGLFGSYESGRFGTNSTEGEVNFQNMMNDGSLDFTSKLTGLTMPDVRK